MTTRLCSARTPWGESLLSAYSPDRARESLHVSVPLQCCCGRLQADRLLDTGNREVILELFARFPKAGAGVARLQAQPSHAK